MRIPTKTKRLELQKDFAGLWVEIRGTLLVGTLEDLLGAAVSNDTPRLRAILAQIVTGANIDDEQDQPIDLTTAEGWRKVPSDFVAEVMDRLNEHLAPPKAPSTESTTSSSSETPSISPATTA
jgi:hypothetical protein